MRKTSRGVVKNIRDQGFDVMLMLEATIGLNQVGIGPESAETESAHDDPLGTFTRNDLTFLKSLRITLPEEEGLELDLDSSADSSEGPPTEV